jgi:hypothetical protein
MRIVFGLYNINIKEYKPAELGIIDENSKDFTFAVKQRIFHIFWIPFFPVMRIYAIIDKNKNAYHASPDLKKILKNAGKHRTPWYSFALPIIGLTTLLSITIADKIERNQNRTSSENRMKEFVAHTSELSNHIKTGDILVLYLNHDWSSQEEQTFYDRLTICVDSISRDEYYVRSKMFNSQNSPTRIKNNDIVQYFIDNDSLPTSNVYIKDEILNFVGKTNPSSPYDGLNGGYELDGKKFVLHHKLSLNGPNLYIKTSSYRSNSIDLDLAYFGPIARIKNFKAIQGITESPVFSKVLANTENQIFHTSMTLPGVSEDSEAEFQLTIETEDGKEYKYHVKKHGTNFYCVLL